MDTQKLRFLIERLIGERPEKSAYHLPDDPAELFRIYRGLVNIGRDEVLNEKVRPLETRLPVSAFYWTPVDPGWNAVMLGIAGCGIS